MSEPPGPWTLPDRGLVVIGTPIGNLGDLSPRAIDALTRVDVVACEDTRRTGRLLEAAGIGRRELVVANDHTEAVAAASLVSRAGSGALIGLVTDAGMPAISDPGSVLVAAFAEAELPIVVVPGPSAVSTAIAGSGLPSGRFVFEGFLPRKGSGRGERLTELATESRTAVLYEAPHRVARTVAELADACGPDRPVCIVREATKRFEEWYRGTLSGAIEWLGDDVKGELVIVLGGAPAALPPSDDDLAAAVRRALDAGHSRRDAVAEVVDRFGVAKRRVYDLALDLD